MTQHKAPHSGEVVEQHPRLRSLGRAVRPRLKGCPFVFLSTHLSPNYKHRSGFLAIYGGESHTMKVLDTNDYNAISFGPTTTRPRPRPRPRQKPLPFHDGSRSAGYSASPVADRG